VNIEAKQRILIAEDDPEMRSLLNDELQDAGYQVIQAADGAEAALRLAQEPFDLVITDLRMPKLGGLELLPLVQRSAGNIPVIVITAFGDRGALKEAVERGAACFLSKPLKMEELKSAVRLALERNGRL
jgi:DNA-binding NtrC family response regulator